MPTPRPLTTAERTLLDGILAQPFPGAEALREQLPHVLAAPGCTCGCGTIDLLPSTTDLPRSTASSPVDAGEVVNEHGSGVGGLLLFLEDGLLSGLEVFAYEDTPLALPTPAQVCWN